MCVGVMMAHTAVHPEVSCFLVNSSSVFNLLSRSRYALLMAPSSSFTLFVLFSDNHGLVRHTGARAGRHPSSHGERWREISVVGCGKCLVSYFLYSLYCSVCFRKSIICWPQYIAEYTPPCPSYTARKLCWSRSSSVENHSRIARGVSNFPCLEYPACHVSQPRGAAHALKILDPSYVAPFFCLPIVSMMVWASSISTRQPCMDATPNSSPWASEL